MTKAGYVRNYKANPKPSKKRQQLLEKRAPKTGASVKTSQPDPTYPKGSDFLKEGCPFYPDQSVDKEQGFAALVEAEKRITKLEEDAISCMKVTWFDWMNYMESTFKGYVVWEDLKKALIAKPKVLRKKSRPDLIAGYTPRQLTFIVRVGSKEAQAAVIKEIESK